MDQRLTDTHAKLAQVHSSQCIAEKLAGVL